MKHNDFNSAVCRTNFEFIQLLDDASILIRFDLKIQERYKCAPSQVRFYQKTFFFEKHKISYYEDKINF